MVSKVPVSKFNSHRGCKRNIRCFSYYSLQWHKVRLSNYPAFDLCFSSYPYASLLAISSEGRSTCMLLTFLLLYLQGCFMMLGIIINWCLNWSNFWSGLNWRCCLVWWYNGQNRLVLLSGCSFTCSPQVCVGFFWVLQFLPTFSKHAIMGCGSLKLSLDANVSVYGAIQWPGVISRVYSHPTPSVLKEGLVHMVYSSTPKELLYCILLKKGATL